MNNKIINYIYSNKLSKLFSGILSTVLALALIVSCASPVANANELFDNNNWRLMFRCEHGDTWAVFESQILDYNEQKSNRQVRISVDYYGSHGSPFLIKPIERTGTFSYENYFDCQGNEIGTLEHGCRVKLYPHESFSMVVKMGDSSWWKSRTGVYIEALAVGDTPIKNALKYSMRIVN
ncbi:MAG: hypothetical protein LBT99_03465 [Bifidobacteriaceae bacterium]|nr:hypothetical protein [Bifidobacteriaceae bacterium]